MRTRLLAVVTILFACSFAYAGSIACSTATVMIPDGRVLDFDSVQANTTNWYSFTGSASRSYSIEVHDDLDADPGTDLTITVYAGGTCPTPTVLSTVTDTHSIEPVSPASKRVSFVA